MLRILKAHLGIDLTRKDVDIAHRMGAYSHSTEESRSIICKFVKRTDKLLIVNKRKLLIETGIVIKEDISQANRKLLHDISKRDNITQAWSHNGKILGKNHDGKIRKFEREIKSAILNYENHHNATGTSSNESEQVMNDTPQQQQNSSEPWNQGQYVLTIVNLRYIFTYGLS